MSEILVYRKKDIEMNYCIVNQFGEYLFSCKHDYITVTPEKRLAMQFYTESAAQELALELQIVTDRWFGVEEL